MTFHNLLFILFTKAHVLVYNRHSIKVFWMKISLSRSSSFWFSFQKTIKKHSEFKTLGILIAWTISEKQSEVIWQLLDWFEKCGHFSTWLASKLSIVHLNRMCQITSHLCYLRKEAYKREKGMVTTDSKFTALHTDVGHRSWCSAGPLQQLQGNRIPGLQGILEAEGIEEVEV